MAHEIDLKKYALRTDLLIDEKLENLDGIIKNTKKIDDVLIEEVEILEKGSKILNKKKGHYKTIIFKDITDQDNYKNVQDAFIYAFNKILEENNIKKDASCLIVGLGNDKSTPDALGPEVLKHILVTKYLFNIGEVQEGFRNTSLLEPNVTGVTGIETSDIITGIISKTKPDFLVVIDALASNSVSRLNKTIQIADTGISPGSGVGNNRKELSIDTLNIPVFAIGIPTIVDAVTIVNDTFKCMTKQFKFKMDNENNDKLKLVPVTKQDYSNYDKELSKAEKEKLLGIVGTLEEDDLKQLFFEVLSPVNYNLMVTPKEIDFLLERFGTLLGNGINKVLHDAYNMTK